MKNLKRTLSMVLALVMALALTTMAFAAEDTTNIKIDNGTTNSTYSAYQIMSLRMSGTEAGGDAAYNYVINDKYASAVLAALTAAGAANVPSDVSGLTTNYLNGSLGQFDAETTRTFANALYEEIVVKAKMAPEFTISDDASGAGKPQGYYLLVENLAAGSDDMRSLVMLDTAGNADCTVTVKKENPTVEKKVEDADSTVAYVGQVLDYTVTANLTKYTSEYKEFNITFTDTMSEGLAYVADSAKVYLSVDGTDAAKQDITSDARTTVSHSNGILTVRVTGLQDVAGIGASSKVWCDYQATITDKASYGDDASKNSNNVVLTYTNDPYWSSTETPADPEPTGETEGGDTVDVITIRLNIAKTDGTDKLAGADFTLWRWDVESAAWVEVAIKEAVTAGTTTDFVFGGIGNGIYRLVESTVPDGRIQMEDKFFKVVAESTAVSDTEWKVTKLEMHTGTITTPVQTIGDDIRTINTQADVDGITWGAAHDGTQYTVTDGSAVVGTTIINESGIKLPATGGQGTTLLYVIGGIVLLVALGGCYIYMRKRNTAEQ